MQGQNEDLVKLSQAVKETPGMAALRSDTERLKRVIGPVEAALANGVRREAVLETLVDAGFSMTLNGFKTALQRVRRDLKAQEK